MGLASKLQNNLYSKLNDIDKRLDEFHKKLEQMETKSEQAFRVLQTHLVRIKNGESLSDDIVLNRRPYNDLSPERAFKVYQDKNADFLLLDVSSKEFQPGVPLPEAVQIPLEELAARRSEISGPSTRIIVISEDGVRSILACEILNRLGFYNVNNISGGYKFWPADKIHSPANGEFDGLESA